MIFFETLLAFIFIKIYIMLLMSILKKNLWIIFIYITVIMLSLTVTAQEETDEILIHYQNRANEVFDSRNPIVSGVNF